MIPVAAAVLVSSISFALPSIVEVVIMALLLPCPAGAVHDHDVGLEPDVNATRADLGALVAARLDHERKSRRRGAESHPMVDGAAAEAVDLGVVSDFESP